MTLNLVTYHKALSPTRRARNNSDRILLSTVFIGTPVPSVLSLWRKRIPNTVNPPRRGRSYPVRDVRFKTVQGQPGSQISGPMLAALRSFLVAGPWCHRTRYVRRLLAGNQPGRPQRNAARPRLLTNPNGAAAPSASSGSTGAAPKNQVGVRIHGCDPPLKHHSTRADNGEQVVVPRWNGGVGGRGALGVVVLHELGEVGEQGHRASLRRSLSFGSGGFSAMLALYEHLQRWVAGAPAVKMLVDRRATDRRSAICPGRRRARRVRMRRIRQGTISPHGGGLDPGTA
jgi:hypothetical protein